jgi:hypothetical protein
VAPETEKPVPLTAAVLTVNAEAPVSDRVSDCFAAVFIFTLPKAMLLALTVRVAPPACNCRGKVMEAPPAVAVRVAVCAEATAETVAAKAALEDPAATVTEAGTVTALLLLVRLTVAPPVGAAMLRVTVQLSVAEPVMDAFVHVSALIAGPIPVPLRVMTAAGLVEPALDALLVSVREPEAAPAAVGSNVTLNAAV